MRSASRKAARDEEHGALALALKQRIGGDRGAHLYRLDALAGMVAPGRNPSSSRIPAIAASR